MKWHSLFRIFFVIIFEGPNLVGSFAIQNKFSFVELVKTIPSFTWFNYGDVGKIIIRMA